MRWFKHLSMAHEDRALVTIMEEMGAEPYGMYWLLLEHVAAQMEKDCQDVPRVTHSDLRWAQILWCSTRKFRKFAFRCAELDLFECRSSAELQQNSSNSPAKLKQFSSRMEADRFEIYVPKLLKYRDEYSRKSGHAPDKLPAVDQRESRSERDTDKKAPSEPKKAPAKAVATPAQIISEFQAMPAFASLNVQREFDKHQAWCAANHRQPTKRAFVNWLNRADVPLLTNGHGPPQDRFELARQKQDEHFFKALKREGFK